MLVLAGAVFLGIRFVSKLGAVFALVVVLTPDSLIPVNPPGGGGRWVGWSWGPGNSPGGGGVGGWIGVGAGE